MRIRRAIIIPAILALAAAGSILASSAAQAAPAPSHSIHAAASSAADPSWTYFFA